MASELRVTTIANNAGTESVDTTYVINGSAKLIVKYNMSGTIQGTSLNVTSVTDAATGRQSPQFVNSFSDANYVLSATCSDTLGGANHAMIANQDYSNTVSSSETRVGIVDGDNGNTFSDADFCSVNLFGDLA